MAQWSKVQTGTLFVHTFPLKIGGIGRAHPADMRKCSKCFMGSLPEEGSCFAASSLCATSAEFSCATKEPGTAEVSFNSKSSEMPVQSWHLNSSARELVGLQAHCPEVAYIVSQNETLRQSTGQRAFGQGTSKALANAQSG